MVRIRRVAAIAVLCFVAAAYGTVSPAHAADTTVTSEVLGGNALGQGLNLEILKGLLKLDPITLGRAESSVTANLVTGVTPILNATALGAGRLLSASEVATSAPKSGSLLDPGGEKCAAVVPIPELLKISIACGNSTSSVQNNFPIATATGKVLDIRVPADGVLGMLLGSVGGTLDGLLGQLLGGGIAAQDTTAASGLLAQTPGGNLLAPVTNLLQGGLLSSLNGILDQTKSTVAGLVPDPLVIALGESNSSVVTTATGVTSSALGRGARITVLPLPLFPNGLLQIIVGDATTTASYDRVAGTSTADYHAAVVSLSVLGVNVPISPNINLTLLAGTPLESTILLGAGRTTIEGKKAGAVADGVSIHLLKGLGETTAGARDGGILLSLAKATSNIGGNLAATTSRTAVLGTVAEAPRQLPRTGPGNPFIPIIGIGVLVAGFFGRRAVLRTR